MPNEQEDESLGLEQLPQTELDSTPGVQGEKPASEEANEAQPNSGLDRPEGQSAQSPTDLNKR